MMDDFQHIAIGQRVLRVHATGQGTPIVYLHGGLGSIHERPAGDERLARLGIRLVRIGDGGAIDEMIGCARRGRSRWPRSAVRSRSGPDSSTATRRRPVRSSWSTRCPARATTSCPGADII